MKVTDRPGLESVACECYGMVRRAQDRLFGMPGGVEGHLPPLNLPAEGPRLIGKPHAAP
jgi:hypothetical protein